MELLSSVSDFKLSSYNGICTITCCMLRSVVDCSRSPNAFIRQNYYWNYHTFNNSMQLYMRATVCVCVRTYNLVGHLRSRVNTATRTYIVLIKTHAAESADAATKHTHNHRIDGNVRVQSAIWLRLFWIQLAPVPCGRTQWWDIKLHIYVDCST